VKVNTPAISQKRAVINKNWIQTFTPPSRAHLDNHKADIQEDGHILGPKQWENPHPETHIGQTGPREVEVGQGQGPNKGRCQGINHRSQMWKLEVGQVQGQNEGRCQEINHRGQLWNLEVGQGHRVENAVNTRRSAGLGAGLLTETGNGSVCNILFQFCTEKNVLHLVQPIWDILWFASFLLVKISGKCLITLLKIIGKKNMKIIN